MERANRLKLIREESKHSQSEFASLLGLTQPHLSAIEAGKREINFKVLEVLKLKFNVSTDWILYGEGERYYPTDTKTDKQPIQLLRSLGKFTLDKQYQDKIGGLEFDVVFRDPA